jgi:catechol 2,3-dioxygenase-like lactoylglutathione lyase family enzyme
MRIREIAITVGDVQEAASFYRDVLKMPVVEEAERVTVRVGFSRLVMTLGEQFEGVHHLAFGVSPYDFDAARIWLKERVDLIVAGGSEVFEGPPGWDSRSVYFLGPEGILLEFIARQADAGRPIGDGSLPSPFSISEIGISVPDTRAAVAELAEALRLPRFPPQQPDFAPVGDHDGLLIVVDASRTWFPTRVHRAASGPVAVRIEASEHSGQVALTKNATITATSFGSQT